MEVPFYGFLADVPLAMTVAGIVVVALAMAYLGIPLLVWAIAGAVAMYGLGAPTWLWVTYGLLVALFNVPQIRRLMSAAVMKIMTAMEFLPRISQTEQEAIDAGTVWVDGELFSGKPDFKRLLAEGYPDLTPEERAFMEGPVQDVCDMTDDWEVFKRRDLPPQTWSFLKKERFFGMIIPKEYGGLGFSPSANSAVVAKLGSANGVLSITVMVPNSLGPAELLIHYGTDAQKKHYLPRLARGEEIPAFALTEPHAGSDAGAMRSHGEVFRGDDGKLYLRLNWNKRYITLAAISTVLGLAFKLSDPDNLLGKGVDLGITCALVPTNTKGVDIGKRHDPMGVPFVNAPTEGHDVVVDLEEAVIGGADGVGRGWRMLMESLAAGRGISLPATSTGGTKHAARAASAHGVVRKQFGLSIGKFEGVEEPMARLGGFTYILEAARRYTNGGLDGGAKPAVVTAIAKYHFTEMFRTAINDGMDILGGNAISRGPRNVLAHGYINTPVSITVEGANILTRTLMIFGQGAIRCHPYALKEIEALAGNDVAAFDRAFWSHVGHVFRNKVRAMVLTLTRGRVARSPVSGPSARYIRKLAWASSSFAFMADLAMASLGGELKRKEKLTGRFADIFSWMYLATAVIKRFEAEGRRKEDRPFFEWSMKFAFHQMQVAFEGLYSNFSMPLIGWVFRGPVAVLARLNPLSRPPSDELGHQVARLLQTPGEQRDRLLEGSFVPSDPSKGVARLESAMLLAVASDSMERKIKAAIREGVLERRPVSQLVDKAEGKGIISSDEADLLRRAEVARDDAIQVDAFTEEEYMRFAAVDAMAGGDGSGMGSAVLSK